MARRERSEPHEAHHWPIDLDPDFDLITSERHRTSDSNRSADSTTTDTPEAEEPIESLGDRLLPTVSTSALTTDSERITTPLRPSSQLVSTVSSVGTVRKSATAGPRDSLSRLEPPAGVGYSEISAEPELPPIADSVGVGGLGKRSVAPISDSVRLEETLAEETTVVGGVQQSAVATDDQHVTKTMTPETFSAGQRTNPELDEIDPGYEWTGGTPYSTVRPQCIIHIDSPDLESLPFLQRVLRDAYTELEGGRPRTETPAPRGGELSRVRLHGAIATLDLTSDEWSVELENERLSISREGRDVVPQLRRIIDSLYGGKLGYLLINIGADDLQSPFRSDLESLLISTLLDVPEGDTETSDPDGLLSKVEAPIRVAKPRYQDRSTFQRVVSRYFGFARALDGRVADIEEAQQARVRNDDWRRVALTERQEGGDGESDEHYLWKAALVDGLAWQLKEQYVQRNSDIPFDTFVQRRLLPSGPIQSEHDVSDGDSVADLYVTIDRSETWVWNGVLEFLDETPLEPSQQTDLILEFETGRGEGAFSFRKLRETVNKYDEDASPKICVVVPPGLLFRSESRARMITRLIEPEDAPTGSRDVAICVPELGSYGCHRLLAAEQLLEEWFGDAE